MPRYVILLIPLLACADLETGSEAEAVIVNPSVAINVPSGGHGKFDPSLTLEAPNRLGLSYSKVGESIFGKTTVDTAAAQSVNGGRTWPLRVNVVTNPPPTIVWPYIYSWWSEVSSITYGVSKWHVVYHRYLTRRLLGGGADEQLFAYGWLEYKSATRFQDLDTAAPIKLLAGAGYLPNPPVPLPPGVPNTPPWSTNAACDVISEPDINAIGLTIYLSFFCAVLEPSGNITKTVELYAAPISPLFGLTHLGTLLDEDDAEARGYDYYNGVDVVPVGDGSYWLLATPIAPGTLGGFPIDDIYYGCHLLHIADLDTASIDRDGAGSPLLFLDLQSTAEFDGACTFHPANTHGGLLFGQAALVGGIGQFDFAGLGP